MFISLNYHCDLFVALLRQSESDYSDSDTSLSMEQQRDISLFSSFYIINCTLQAIQAAADHSTTSKSFSSRSVTIAHQSDL